MNFKVTCTNDLEMWTHCFWTGIATSPKGNRACTQVSWRIRKPGTGASRVPGLGDPPPRSPPGAGTGVQHRSGKLESERGKDRKVGFSGRICFRSKLTPIRRIMHVLCSERNTGACVQLWRPLKKTDSSEHAVLGATSKSWTITKQQKKSLNTFYILHQRCHYKNTIVSHIN